MLDKNYQPIRIVNLKGAIYLIFREVAHVLDQDYNIFNLQEWLRHSELRHNVDEDFKALRSVNSAFGIPEVLKLKHFKQRKARKSSCTKNNIAFRDLHICQYCGKCLTHAGSTIDHIVPVSKGGTLSWDNVVTACKECNNKKGNKDLDKSGLMLLNIPKPLFWDREYFRKYERRFPNEVWKRFL